MPYNEMVFKVLAYNNVEISLCKFIYVHIHKLYNYYVNILLINFEMNTLILIATNVYMQHRLICTHASYIHSK